MLTSELAENSLDIGNRADKLERWRSTLSMGGCIKELHDPTQVFQYLLVNSGDRNRHEATTPIAGQNRVVWATRLPERAPSDASNWDSMWHSADLLISLQVSQLLGGDELVMGDLHDALIGG